MSQVVTNPPVATTPVSSSQKITPEQEIFYEGRRIGEDYNQAVRTATATFLQKAIPFGYKVLELRPWTAKEFVYFANKGDDYTALREFLRASFTDTSGSMAAKISCVVAMIVADKKNYKDVENIPVSYLIRLSSLGRFMSASQRTEALKIAKTSNNIANFEERMEGIRNNLYVGNTKGRIVSGSESAMSTLSEFDQRTKDAGDTRPEADKVADAVAITMLSEPDFAGQTVYTRVFGLTAKFLKRRDGQLQTESNTKVIGDLLFMMLSSYIEEFDEEIRQEYEEIKEMLAALQSDNDKMLVM